MKKIVAILLITLLASLLLPFTVYAADDNFSYYVADAAGLLTDIQQRMLEVRAGELSNKYRCDVRIITVDDMADYGFRRLEDFSYTVYTAYDLGYGSGKDCVIFALSMADRDYDLRVWGTYGNTVFTLYGIDNLLDKYVLKELKNDDYNKAFSVLLDRAEVYFKMAEDGTPFDKGTDSANKTIPLIIIIIASLLIALVVCSIWKSKMKTAKIARTAGNYIPQGGFRLTGHGDMFMYRTVTRTKIQTSSSSGGRASGGGSGGSSGRSGKF